MCVRVCACVCVSVNQIDDDVIEIEEEKIYNKLIENRELVKSAMTCNGI